MSSYQRDTSTALVDQIANDWDVVASEPIVVPKEVQLRDGCEIVRPLTDEEYAALLLEKAADRVEQGWTRGGFAVFGNVCAIGAMGSVIRHDPTFPTNRKRRARIREIAERAFVRMINISRPFDALRDNCKIQWWNDHQAMSKQEVARKFREASARRMR